MCVTYVLTSQSAREGTSLANKRVSLGQEPLKKAMLDQKVIGVEPDPILGLHLVIYLELAISYFSYYFLPGLLTMLPCITQNCLPMGSTTHKGLVPISIINENLPGQDGGISHHRWCKHVSSFMVLRIVPIGTYIWMLSHHGMELGGWEDYEVGSGRVAAGGLCGFLRVSKADARPSLCSDTCSKGPMLPTMMMC